MTPTKARAVGVLVTTAVVERVMSRADGGSKAQFLDNLEAIGELLRPTGKLRGSLMCRLTSWRRRDDGWLSCFTRWYRLGLRSWAAFRFRT